jgi:hypothetical protein
MFSVPVIQICLIQAVAEKSPQHVAKDLFGGGRSNTAAKQVSKTLFKEPASVEARTQASQSVV